MKNYFILAVGLLVIGADVNAAASYHLEARWGRTGAGAGKFREPMGIAVDREGFVYIAGSRKKRIQKLRPEGRFVMQFGKGADG